MNSLRNFRIRRFTTPMPSVTYTPRPPRSPQQYATAITVFTIGCLCEAYTGTTTETRHELDASLKLQPVITREYKAMRGTGIVYGTIVAAAVLL
jgi:hypothetical protein